MPRYGFSNRIIGEALTQVDSGLDAEKLDALFSIVRDGSYKEFKGLYNVQLRIDYPLLFEKGGSGAWIYLLPDQSVYTFATKFEREDLPSLAKLWMKTGMLTSSGG
jgi:hypothetical protein